MNSTYVRCHCCGEWQLIYNWNNTKPTYCESCEEDSSKQWRTGKGRGQCKGCVEYPQRLQHWNDAKPPMPVFHMYIR